MVIVAVKAVALVASVAAVAAVEVEVGVGVVVLWTPVISISLRDLLFGILRSHLADCMSYCLIPSPRASTGFQSF